MLPEKLTVSQLFNELLAYYVRYIKPDGSVR
jgi:hypothetical protein